MVSMDKVKVCILGLGYIGLPTAAVMAEAGLCVHGVDVDEHVVEMVNDGQAHITEPELDQLVHNVVHQGQLVAGITPCAADYFIIAVPTPFKENKQPNLAYVKQACVAIAPYLQAGSVVIIESTSPVGTTQQCADWLQALRPELHFPGHGDTHDVHLCYCPERVLPGKILQELRHNVRIIGGLTPRCSEQAARLYRHVVHGECLMTTAATAELSKLAENAYRDVNIAFANELSMIAGKADIDVWELINLANHHPRVKILQPGPGVGGHCIAVDPWFIVSGFPEQAKLIKQAREVNDYKPVYVVERIIAAVKESEIKSLAFLGLSYKPNVGDFRESPAVEVVRQVAKKLPQLQIMVVEPYLSSLPTQLCSQSLQLVSIEEAIAVSDKCLVLVDHDVFLPLKEALLEKEILDVFRPDEPLSKVEARKEVVYV